MDIVRLLNSLTPDIYQNLKRAVELGKWPDGRRLTKEQRHTCMQAMIAYEHRHLPPQEHTGYIPPKPHEPCGKTEQDEPLKWQE